jgi:hypothetical protein
MTLVSPTHGLDIRHNIGVSVCKTTAIDGVSTAIVRGYYQSHFAVKSLQQISQILDTPADVFAAT